MQLTREEDTGSGRITILMTALLFEAGVIRSLLRGKTPISGKFQGTSGFIGKHRILLLICGEGAGDCAPVLDFLLKKYHCFDVIFFGTAGAIKSRINIGDVIIANKPLSWTLSNKERTSSKKIFGATCSSRYLTSEKRGDDQYSYRIFRGRIVTWPSPIANRRDRTKIFDASGAYCVDMETGYAVTLCAERNISFLAVRGISDIPGDEEKCGSHFNKSLAVWNVSLTVLEALSSKSSISWWRESHCRLNSPE